MTPRGSPIFPALVTGLRAATIPLLVVSLRAGADTQAVLLLGFAALTDIADGWVARRLAATSVAGAYLDVTVDFLLVSAGLATLAARGLYPAWLVLVPALVFALFLLSSGLRTPIYDPVGKCYGGFLVGVVVASLLLLDLAVHALLFGTILGLSAVTLIARGRWLLMELWPRDQTNRLRP